MALVTYPRSNVVDTTIGRILTENGYVDISSSPFVGQIVATIKGAIQSDLTRIYDIAQNVDIGRAAGEFLDRWGRFLNEPRQSVTYAYDLSLSNVFIAIDPAINAGELTQGGTGFEIPERTIIRSSGSGASVVLITPAYMRADRNRVFCNVMTTVPGAIFISQDELDSVNFQLSSVEGIIPSVLSRYKLVAGNTSSISGGENLSDDQTYQYILQEAAGSIGLFNEQRINTLLDIMEIVAVSIQEYVGGVNVFIETRNPALSQAAVEMARISLMNRRPLGSNVSVFPPVFRTLKLQLQVELSYPETDFVTVNNVKRAFYEQIIGTTMGTSIDLASIRDAVKAAYPNIVGIRISQVIHNGRTMMSTTIGQKFNEKTIISEEDITVL